ncbi:MAG: DUF89 family protein [Fibrobacter sp.]|nr:DUF89 family protein [Fibrobacter sp.]
MYNKVNPLCYPCVLNQALSTAKHLDLCESDTKDLLSVAMNYLEVSRYKPMMVQHIVRYITDVAQAKSGKTDVYHEVKLFSHKIAQKYAEQMRTQIPHHPQPLQYAIKLAAAGNIIDFGAKSHGDLNIEA